MNEESKSLGGIEVQRVKYNESVRCTRSGHQTASLGSVALHAIRRLSNKITAVFVVDFS